MIGIRWITWIGAVGLVGCASGTFSFGGDGPPTIDAAAPVGAALTVEGTSSPATIKSIAPQPGRRFLALRVTLGNVGTEALATSFERFSLDTDATLTFLPSAASAFTGAPCAVDTFVAPGGSFACEVVFEVPLGERALKLRYDDRLGHGGVADVPPPAAPNACALAECWTGTRRFVKEGDACLDCLWTMCQPEITAVATTCRNDCNCAEPSGIDLAGAAAKECECFAQCPTPRPCGDAMSAYSSCALGCARLCDDAKCPAPP